jgi:hypothetical protein
MSIAYKASTTAAAGGGTSLSINVPTVSDGDLMVLVGISSYNLHSLITPAGWTFTIAGSVNNQYGITMCHRIASSEPASYTVGFTGGAADITLAMATYSGVDNGTPLDVSGSQVNASNSTATAPSVTTTRDADVLVHAYLLNNASGFTLDNGTDNLRRLVLTPSSDKYLALADIIAGAAGATGAYTGSLGVAATSVGLMAAFKAQVAAPGGGAGNYFEMFNW